jgi:hypothetical protein
MIVAFKQRRALTKEIFLWTLTAMALFFHVISLPQVTFNLVVQVIWDLAVRWVPLDTVSIDTINFNKVMMPAKLAISYMNILTFLLIKETFKFWANVKDHLSPPSTHKILLQRAACASS